jgi:molybdopterin converting factor small subunit
MLNVVLDFWMWMGSELRGHPRSSSGMRSLLEVEVETGTTVRTLLDRMAREHPVVAQRIFNRENQCLYPHVVGTFNDLVIRESDLYDTTLSEGDKITILPMYAGG